MDTNEIIQAKDQFVSLKQIVTQCQKIKTSQRLSTVGLIIDSTLLLKKSKNIKIRITDPSLFQSNSPYRYCEVNFPSKNNKIQPFMLGDLLLLKNFVFRIGNYRLKTFKDSKIEKWAFFSLLPSNSPLQTYLTNYIDIQKIIKGEQEKYRKQLTYINCLRIRGYMFFKKGSFLNIQNNQKDFLVILHKIENNKIFVFDGTKILQIQGSALIKEELRTKALYKLRSYEQLKENIIIANDFTNLIELPNFCYDAQQFIKNNLYSGLNPQIQQSAEI